MWLPSCQTQKVYIDWNLDGWSLKTQNRKGTGTGRTRYLKTITRVYKNQIKGRAQWSNLFKQSYA